MKLAIFILALTACAGLLHARPTAIAATPNGECLLVTIESPASLKVYDTNSLELVTTIPLPAQPTGIALAVEDSRIFVTAGIAPGRLLVIDSQTGSIVREIEAGHSPQAPLLSADGNSVFVCNRFENEVRVIDWKTGETTGKIEVLREPIAAVLSKDGTALFVANHLPVGRADIGNISAAVSVIDLATGESKIITLPNGSTGVEGIAISPDGKDVYLTHTLARYGLPTTQVDRGWMNTSGISVIDAINFKHRATVLLDDIDLGAANPWGIACSPDGKTIYVSHAGTHEVSVIDREKLEARILQTEQGDLATAFSDSPADIANDLGFLVGIRERRRLSGRGPRHVVALPGKGCAVAAYFSGTLHLVGDKKITDQKIAEVPSDDPAFRGEMIFHDASACFQQWQSCSTCHPGVRTDALNWDLLNDGVGNPKQAKSMLFAMQTPPSMVSAIRDGAPTAIRAGFRHIQFALRPEADAKDIEAFLTSMPAVPSPALIDGELSPSAERGKAVFKDARCIYCHSGEHFTDLQQHNIGTGRDVDPPWDTPTLRESWRTAPYLHDGRAPTLESVFTEHNSGDLHGKTSDLSPEELTDLLEYLRSL